MKKIIILMVLIYSSLSWASVPKKFKAEMVANCGADISLVVKKVLIGILRSEKTYFYHCDKSIELMLFRYCPSLSCNQVVNIYHKAAQGLK